MILKRTHLFLIFVRILFELQSMDDTFKNTIQQARMVEGGERGVMCRTMHKKDLKRDSTVPY